WAYMALGAALSAQLLYGIKPAVVAVVAFAAWRIGSRVLRQPMLWAIAAGAFAGVFFLGLPFPVLILIAGVLGWVFRARLRAGGGHGGKAAAGFGPALIDDATPIPAHALFSRAGLVRVLGTGLVLWAASLLLVYLLGGGLYTHLATFFTKAALVTFGGAYAVMPYVFQNAVETYHWLSPAQMIDGLALGETTPGPLIMVVAYIGYVAAWLHAGALSLPLAGALGATVATWFTFLPSFVFILAGGPWVEHTREDFKLAGPLTAITAAVVGAILYLAVYFAGHVFWPADGPDLLAIALAAVAFLALYRNWLGMIPVILGTGLLGFCARLLIG
ncbi:MAG TPA: chromate transporter, partial [Solimonas sp.]|nr:chromate transporter [Solimonas sp.]